MTARERHTRMRETYDSKIETHKWHVTARERDTRMRETYDSERETRI